VSAGESALPNTRRSGEPEALVADEGLVSSDHRSHRNNVRPSVKPRLVERSLKVVGNAKRLLEGAIPCHPLSNVHTESHVQTTRRRQTEYCVKVTETRRWVFSQRAESVLHRVDTRIK
jgi:hypothetical protein